MCRENSFLELHLQTPNMRFPYDLVNSSYGWLVHKTVMPVTLLNRGFLILKKKKRKDKSFNV